MTNEEAIKILKTELEVRSDGYYDHLQSGGNGDCEEEASLNALQLAIEALEKQIPQKPKIKGKGGWMEVCPTCGSLNINTAHGICLTITDKADYCPRCGQAIDWSDTE